VRIIATGEPDIASAPKLREQTDVFLADHAEIIVLDLTAVSSIDSTGIHAVLEAAKRGPHASD
jgi:anti-anti-sigma factor